jgi:hypothetical protein
MVARALDVMGQVQKYQGLGVAMSSSSWNLSSISRALCTARHELLLVTVLGRCYEHLRVCICLHMAGYRILALQGRRVGAWCVGAQGRWICHCRPGAGLAAFLLQGLSEEQLSGTSLDMC